MAFVGADWSIDRQTRAITYIGDDHTGASPSYASVIEFHRALQDFADDAGYSGDDELDITDPTPSDRSTDNIVTLINGWTIDDTAAEHIYDGSIIQSGGNVIYDGIKILAPIGTVVQFLQDGAAVSDDWWNNGVAASGADDSGGSNNAFLTDSGESWTTDQWKGYRIFNTTDGSFADITANTATTITGTLQGGTDNDWDNGDAYYIADGLNNDATNGVSHNFMLKVRTGGTDTDGRRLVATTRMWGRTFLEFKVNGTTRGINVVALATQNDLNNTTSATTVAGYDDVTNDRTTSSATVNGVNSQGATTLNVSDGGQFSIGQFIAIDDGADLGEYQITNIVTNALTITPGLDVATTGGETIYNIGYGYEAIDVDNDTTDENYYTKWTRGSRTINQFYERMKYLGRDSTANRLFGLGGEVFRGITHEITVDTPTGTFYSVESVSWGSGATAGTGRMFAINSPTAATKMWIQLLTGVAPTDGLTITGALSGATVDVNVTVTDRTVSTPFVGVSTGSALIGAYGFGVLAADLTQNDKVFDLTNTQYSPPNIVTFTVSGLVNSPNDRLLVGPKGFRFAYDNEANGPFTVGDTLTFGGGGTAVLAELYDNGTTGFMYIGEMVTGDPPVDNESITGVTGDPDPTADVNGSVSNDINLRQLTLSTALTTGTETAVVVNEAIPVDTPNTSNQGTKTIRIELDDGRYIRQAYNSWSGSTFSITSSDFSGANAASSGNNVFISYIDAAITSGSSSAFSGVYSADRNLFIRVRSGSGATSTLIKTFETTGTLGSSGGSTTAIRTPDA